MSPHESVCMSVGICMNSPYDPSLFLFFQVNIQLSFYYLNLIFISLYTGHANSHHTSRKFNLHSNSSSTNLSGALNNNTKS